MIEHRVLLRIVLLVLLAGQGICNKTYDIGYKAGMTGCPDFNNDYLNGDGLDVGKTGDEEAATFLEGCLEVVNSIIEGTFINIEIAKETEIGSEPMYSFSMDICESLKDKDAPWAEAMKSMNITGCPIEVGSYCCEKFYLDTSFMKDFMDHEFMGNYDTNVAMMDSQRNRISCHQMGLCIYEIDKDAK